MTHISLEAKHVIKYGFNVGGQFFDWEVLEELTDYGTYFFMNGSNHAEPLIKAGLAEWSGYGDGTIIGTVKADELYNELRVKLLAMQDNETKTR